MLVLQSAAENGNNISRHNIKYDNNMSYIIKNSLNTRSVCVCVYYYYCAAEGTCIIDIIYYNIPNGFDISDLVYI